MLGVHRPTVTVAINALEKRGVIAAKRGLIEILDFKGLQHMACECYAISRAATSAGC